MTLSDGTTHQFKPDEPESTYEEGEYIRVGERRKKIVLKSKVTVPTGLEGDEWREFCRRGLGGPETEASEGSHEAQDAAAA